MKLRLRRIASNRIALVTPAYAFLALAAFAPAQVVSWTELSPVHSPPVRGEHAMTYDSTRERVVLFGGRSDSGNLGDTWEWDGANWIQRFPASSPPNRRWQGMAYDPVRQRVVLFAGSWGASEISDDTWEWDGDEWTQRFPAHVPPPRRHPGLVYDAARGKVVLFGGRGFGRYADTWEWDGVDWVQRFPATNPAAREGHVMAYDTSRERVVMFGGGTTVAWNDTWEWDGTDWTQRLPTHRPPNRTLACMTYDAELGVVVLHGGANSVLFADTWLWDGEDWTEVTPASGPSARWATAIAYDAARRRTVLAGGQDGVWLSDTWALHRSSPNDGSFRPFGTGCAGAVGVPLLSAEPRALATPGQDFSVRFENLHPSRLCVPFGILGDSREAIGTMALPLWLGTWGMTGCWLRVSNLDAEMLPNELGTATWTLPIPDDPLLVGFTFYVQGAVVEPNANPLGVVMTNGGEIEIRQP